MRACPYCAEQIQEAAILCRYCGKSVTPVASAGARGRRAPALSPLLIALLALLLIMLGVGLLYAYRAQSPAGTVVSYGQAVTEIQSGQVHVVTFNGDLATLDLLNGTRQTVTLGGEGTTSLHGIVRDYNATVPPAQRITVAASGSCC